MVEENGVCGGILGEVVREAVLRRYHGNRDLKEVRDMQRKSSLHSGNGKCKGPEGECAIPSHTEDLWEVDDFYFGHTALRCLQDIRGQGPGNRRDVGKDRDEGEWRRGSGCSRRD